MKKQYQITLEGKKELEKELELLKSRRGAIADKIAEARDFGDLSENAEYDAAREEQGLLETRVSEIEEILNNAEIIKASRKKTIDLGSTVELKVGNKSMTIRLLGQLKLIHLQARLATSHQLAKRCMAKRKVKQQQSPHQKAK
jgi:transcription elongation factor GreA